MNDRFIVFDIWADYAHFRKYYTTSSPLTFSIPPRTALIGLIAAILGLGKDKYLTFMTKDKSYIAIRILAPIKKIRMGQNLINTKDGYWIPVARGFHEPRTQIRFEYLKDVKFRIYLHHADEAIQKDLFIKLKEHKSIYTPCLGLSELLGDFSLVGEYQVEETLTDSNFLDVDTVLPLDVVDKLDLVQEGKKFFKECIPTEMLPGRVVTEYKEVIYEVGGKPIRAKLKSAIVLENDDVITPL